jgi:hypothetical protein
MLVEFWSRRRVGASVAGEDLNCEEDAGQGGTFILEGWDAVSAERDRCLAAGETRYEL